MLMSIHVYIHDQNKMVFGNTNSKWRHADSARVHKHFPGHVTSTNGIYFTYALTRALIECYWSLFPVF